MADPLISHDGSPFHDKFLKAISAELDALPEAKRQEFRNRNSDAIAALLVPRVLIVSGPGTGKSNIFLRRIEKWLASDAGGVLVTSFVRKLVQDLDRDLAQDTHLTEDQKKHVRVFTLHKLSRRLVEQSHGTTSWPFRPFFKIIAWPWRDVVWEDVLAFGAAGPDGVAATLEEFEEYLHLNEPDPAAWSKVRNVYFKLCAFFNAAGFSDLIVRAREVIEEHPELVPEDYFIVDEYQDFNLAEQAMIDAFCTDAKGVLLAGDDDQVLYEHLKAGDPTLIRGLYEGAEIANAMLPYCSRCGHHITKTAAAFVREHADSGRINKIFLPLDGPANGARVTAIGCATPATAVSFVHEWLEEHHDALVARQSDLAEGRKKESFVLFLTPSRKLKFLGNERSKFLEEVAAYRGDVRGQLSEDYYNAAVFFAVGLHPTDNFELRKGLHLRGVKSPGVHKLIVQALAQQCSLSVLNDDDVRQVLETGRVVVEACEQEDDARRLAKQLAKLIVLADPAQLAVDLEARPLNDSAITQLQQEQEAAAEQQGVGEQSAHAAEVLTIVGAKGLSADHVILLGCDDVSLAHVSPKAFFVGLTRARKSLTLIANMKAVGAQRAHAYVLGLPESNVDFAKYTKSGGLEEFDSAEEFAAYFERLAYATRRASSR